MITPGLSSIDVAEPVEIIAFYGGNSFGLVALVAADLEAQGCKPVLEWRRDARGIIDGLAIVGVPR